jgi:predicted RNA-binding protein Jag
MSELESKKKVEAEGKDLVSAIATAAAELGVEPSNVGYKLDLSHFRSDSGGMLAKQTVRIIGWVDEGNTSWSAVSAKGHAVSRTDDREAGPRKKRGRERDRKRDSSREGKRESGHQRESAPNKKKEPRERRREREPAQAPLDGSTEASDRAGAWFGTLLERMGIQGTVVATGKDKRVHLDVRAERAGRIIGKRGSTLRAIRHLLKRALAEYGEVTLDIDVEDTRPREQKGTDRPSERKRGGPKGGADKGGYPEEKLRALARRAAEKARETGKTITINLELTSYDRRIVHLEVAEMEGVGSESEEKDGVKYVQVIPG